jgi:hypothetical protein
MSSPVAPASPIHSTAPVLGDTFESDDVLNVQQDELPSIVYLEYGSWYGIRESASSRLSIPEEPIVDESENPNSQVVADSEDEGTRACEKFDNVVSGSSLQKVVEDDVSKEKNTVSITEKTVEGSARVDEVEFLHETVADMFEAAKTDRMKRRESRKRKQIEASSQVILKKRKGVEDSSKGLLRKVIKSKILLRLS